MSNPTGLISPNKAKELNDAYNERHTLISNDITKRPDNRSVWFSLDNLKSFLDYAEAQAKDLGKTMNGVRIYCGAYETVDGNPGLTTSFLIPTTSNDAEGESGGGSKDIQGADGLNLGQGGDPPQANYPQ